MTQKLRMCEICDKCFRGRAFMNNGQFLDICSEPCFDKVMEDEEEEDY